MGGLIAIHALLLEKIEAVRAVVLSSPLLGVAVTVPVLKEKIGTWAAKYLPHLTIYNEIPNEDLTKDRAVITEYEKDTLRHDQISLTLYVQLGEAMKAANSRAGEFTKPILLQQSGTDRVVSVSAEREFFGKVSSEDKKIITYDDMYHEIYNEVGREAVFADLRQWLTEHL
jgi:alpha-beta hydrolase superfamily lysophospholipase